MDSRLRKAVDLNNQGKLKDAEDIYYKLLDENPEDPTLLLLIGALYNRRGHFGLAMALSRQALYYKPDFAEALNNLGVAYRENGETDKAMREFRKSLKILENAETYNNLSACYINEVNPEQGVEYADKAIELNPKLAHAYWNKSLCLLEMGKLKEGFELYEHGFAINNRVERNYNVPFWNGEKGKNVVVFGEQGIGDELMFASLIPNLIKDCKKVYFDCHPRLETLFRRAFPEIEVHGTRKKDMIDWIVPNSLDAKIAVGSLPRFYPEFFEGEKKPYITATPIKLESKKPVIGISWEGGKKKTRNDLRSIHLEQWLPILKNDATFVSLQYTDGAKEEVAELERKHGIKVHHWQDIVKGYDYDLTASVVSGCDLVISVNTSIVHLCGVMGKECWVLTPTRCAWRYQRKGERMPFYGDHITQFRQKNDNWTPIVEKLGKKLRERFNLKMLEKRRPNVVIVGHGPSMLAEPMGKFIDEHDIIIRMKRCQDTLDHPTHFGSHTDVVCGSFTIGPQLRQVNSKEYWIFLDSRHKDILDDKIEAMQEWFSPKKCLIDRELCDSWNEKYRDLRDKKGSIPTPDQVKEFTPMGHNHLSAGLHTLLYACKHLNPSNIDLIGCDNLATGQWSWSITRGPDWNQYPDHRWDVEHDMVQMVSDHFNIPIQYILPTQEEKCA